MNRKAAALHDGHLEEHELHHAANTHMSSEDEDRKHLQVMLVLLLLLLRLAARGHMPQYHGRHLPRVF